MDKTAINLCPSIYSHWPIMSTGANPDQQSWTVFHCSLFIVCLVLIYDLIKNTAMLPPLLVLGTPHRFRVCTLCNKLVLLWVMADVSNVCWKWWKWYITMPVLSGDVLCCAAYCVVYILISQRHRLPCPIVLEVKFPTFFCVVACVAQTHSKHKRGCFWSLTQFCFRVAV